MSTPKFAGAPALVRPAAAHDIEPIRESVVDNEMFAMHPRRHRTGIGTTLVSRIE